VIRDEMEQTRANLAEKLGALENQVRETVSGATEAVSSTVDGVKNVVSSVSETVESVTETFNFAKHVERHPWVSVGAAFATGFVIAQVIGRSSEPAPAPAPAPSGDLPLQLSGSSSAASQPRAAEARDGRHESGMWKSIERVLPDMGGVMNTVVSSLGGLAVGGLMGVIREMASTGLPKEWQGDVTKLIDQVTTQLGGKPVDSSKSGQLFNALGLGDFLAGLSGQGGQQQNQGGQQSQGGQQQSQGVQQRQGSRPEGAPYDTQRQGGQGGSASVTGTRGTSGAGRQPQQRL